jgi:hypothetical protein
MGEILNNLQHIHNSIHHACAQAGRDPGSVQLIAISKRKSAEAIRQAYEAGQRVFGENYVQEFLEKKNDPLLNECDIEWHFTGHLQSNKIKYIIDEVQMIQTIDKRSTAETLSKRAQSAGLMMPILLEVNISGELTKGGFSPENLFEEAEQIAHLPNLSLKGLMTIGSPDLDVVGREFARMRLLLEDLARRSPQPAEVCELSMGMSQDYEIAIQEGATMIRLGTSIFGAR